MARTATRVGALVPVLLPVLATLLVGGWGIDRGSMWLDEEATYDAAHRSPAQIVALVHHTDVVHAAYYLLMHAWVVLGSHLGPLLGGQAAAGGEVWLRVPSLLAAALSAGLIAAIGRRLVGPRAGLLAGLVWATVPFVSFYAQEARSYSLVAAAVLAATYLLLRAVAAGGGWWVGYAAAVVVAQTLNELAVLVLAAHLLTLGLSRAPRRTWLRWGACAVVAVVLLLPLAWASERQSAQISWVTRPTLATVGALLRSLLGPGPVVLVVLGLLIVIGLVVPGLARVAGPLLVVPPGVLLLVSLVDPLYVDRYVFYAVAGVPLLAGAGLDRLASLVERRLAALPNRLADGLADGLVDRLPERLPDWLVERLPERLYERWDQPRAPRAPRGPSGMRAGRVVADVACAVVVGAVLLVQLPALRDLHTVRARAQDLAGAAAVVRAGAEPGDGVVFLPPGLRGTALAYPLAFAGVTDLTLDRSPIASATLRGTERTLPAIRTAMLAAPRIWLVGQRILHVDPARPEESEELDLLGLDFHRLHRFVLHGMVISLYARNTG